jgi:hypothetical protein
MVMEFRSIVTITIILTINCVSGPGAGFLRLQYLGFVPAIAPSSLIILSLTASLNNQLHDRSCYYNYYKN